MAALLPGDENSNPPPVTKERKQRKKKESYIGFCKPDIQY
jgi:hypothetical protein